MNDDDEQSYGPHTTASSVARLEERLRNALIKLDQLETLLDKYLTRIEFMAHFWPVRALVYGMAALLLSSVLAAIVGMAKVSGIAGAEKKLAAALRDVTPAASDDIPPELLEQDALV